MFWIPVLLSGQVHERWEQGGLTKAQRDAGVGAGRDFTSTVPIMLCLLLRVSMGVKGLQILVIEDAVDVRAVLTLLLRMEGADVTGVCSGHEALAVFRSRSFDVVVCDLGLADISGDVLIRTIIAAARRPIKVVVITGDSQPAVIRALEAGAEVIFTKPCPWERVVTYLDGLDVAGRLTLTSTHLPPGSVPLIAAHAPLDLGPGATPE